VDGRVKPGHDGIKATHPNAISLGFLTHRLTPTSAATRNSAYQIVSAVDVFFDDKILNPFIGAGALGIIVDDFNGDNFDH